MSTFSLYVKVALTVSLGRGLNGVLLCSATQNIGENFIILRMDAPEGFDENEAGDEEAVVEDLETELANMRHGLEEPLSSIHVRQALDG